MPPTNAPLPPDPFTADLFAGALAALDAEPKPLSGAQIEREMAKCAADAVYFIDTYCQIYDNDIKGWLLFKLWDFQRDMVRDMQTETRLIVLKTRQIGATWTALAYALWQMLFWPIAEVLCFSQREDEALALIGEERLRGMFKMLPDWLRLAVKKDNDGEFRLSNGSGIRALPGSAGGDSRTVTLVIIDEADLIDDFNQLMTRAKPTLGQKGQLFVISRANKKRPNSPFKRLYAEAKKGLDRWKTVFVPWFAHPLRTQAFYESECREALATEGSLDSIHEHLPATDTEALAARSLDKRFLADWIAALSSQRQPLPPPASAPDIPGLRLYRLPVPGRAYGVGADPAGGKNDGDDAVACVVDSATYEQVAVFAGKLEPAQFGGLVADLALYYNNAPILFELNNHGHAVRIVLKARGANLRMGQTKHGPSRNPGWLTTDWSKATMYNTVAKVMQEALVEAEARGDRPPPLLFDFTTIVQIASIDVNTLSAPENEHDDHAVAYALAEQCVYQGVPSMQQVPHVGLWGRTIDAHARSVPPPALPAGRVETMDEMIIRLRTKGGR